jgi:DNA-binding NtrC family response regulator
MKQRILVVDDEVGPREALKAVFGKAYEVEMAANADAAMEILQNKRCDLVLLDVMMPGKDGLEFLRDVQGLYPKLPVVMISASSSVRPVVEAMRVGAYDYVSKPFDVEEILHIAKRAMESERLHRCVAALASEVAREFPVKGVVGESPAFTAALHDVEKAADTDATVLIGGESGTGKELAARILHALSSRKDEPFVAVHCAALPETLMESELFGHEKGAFTGADKQKPGRFDLAGSGTLFFDEVGEMSLATQVKLLRVLQEREFMRVGGTRPIRTNARIVAATARDLRAEVKEGRFRDDLYYRLSVVPVHLPPLRRRGGDIPLLARHFLQAFGHSMDSDIEDFSPAALDLLCAYAWPGNIRELRNIIERMVVLYRRERLILPEFLPEEFHEGGGAAAAIPEGGTLQQTVNAFERNLIEKALIETEGVQTRAAKKLGTTRRILRYRMDKLDIRVPAPS